MQSSALFTMQHSPSTTVLLAATKGCATSGTTRLRDGDVLPVAESWVPQRTAARQAQPAASVGTNALCHSHPACVACATANGVCKAAPGRLPGALHRRVVSHGEVARRHCRMCSAVAVRGQLGVCRPSVRSRRSTVVHARRGLQRNDPRPPVWRDPLAPSPSELELGATHARWRWSERAHRLARVQS